MSAEAHSFAPPSVSERCLYLAHLGAGLAAIAAGALACGGAEWRLGVAAAAATAVSWGARSQLAADERLAACLAEDDAPVAAPEPGADEARRRRAPLLRRIAALERLRGTARFDPWALLELRRQLGTSPVAPSAGRASAQRG